MSQLYSRMEEDVAKKVRETMELADARRRALIKEDNKSKQTELEDAIRRAPRKPGALRRQGLEDSDGFIDTSVRIVEGIASELTENDFTTGKAVTAKEAFLAKDIRTVIDNQKNVLAEHSNTPQFHIGFEHIRDKVDKKQISDVGQTTELPAASYLLDKKRELALGALSLAQTAAHDIDNQPYIVDEADKRQLAEGALNLAQSAAWNIDNKLHETADANQRHLAEGALILAQSAAWNISNKVQDSNETDKTPEGDLNITSAEGTSNVAKRDPPDGELNLALAEGALNLAKNAAWNIDNRLETDTDKRGLAEGALSLAQNAAWNIDSKVYETEGEQRRIAEGALRLAQNASRDLDGVQTADTNRRELAETALNIAQSAAKNVSRRPKDMVTDRGLSREAGSLEGDSFECDPENRNKKLQLGFDHFAALHDGIRNDTELGEVLDEINKRTLAEHDKKTVSAAEAKMRQLSEDLQNLEMDIDNNNYNATEIDDSKKELAVGALNLAQMGARHIGEEVRETSDTKMRELAEGALGLAQTAAKEQLLREGAERSLEDAVFKKIVDQHKQTLQLGFEQIGNSLDSEFEQADDQVQHPPRLHGSRTNK